jgi:hypothetical protein
MCIELHFFQAEEYSRTCVTPEWGMDMLMLPPPFPTVHNMQ